MGKSIDTRAQKGSIDQIKQKVEEKRGKLEDLKRAKEELLEAATAVEGANFDEKVRQRVHDALNQSILENRERGETEARELNEGNLELEQILEDNMGAIDDAQAQKQKLQGPKRLLDKLGGSKNLDSAISDLDGSIAELQEVSSEARKAMSDLQRVSSSLSGL